MGAGPFIVRAGSEDAAPPREGREGGISRHGVPPCCPPPAPTFAFPRLVGPHSGSFTFPLAFVLRFQFMRHVRDGVLFVLRGSAPLHRFSLRILFACCGASVWGCCAATFLWHREDILGPLLFPLVRPQTSEKRTTIKTTAREENALSPACGRGEGRRRVGQEEKGKGGSHATQVDETLKCGRRREERGGKREGKGRKNQQHGAAESRSRGAHSNEGVLSEGTRSRATRPLAGATGLA